MKKVFLSIALFVSAIFTVNAQTADEVITKYITEIGGAEKWAKVQSIKITLYRLSKNSQIVSSLINAAKNGKKVTVQIELQARFDEASNISYAEQMQEEGINLIFGVKGLKVHSKICLVERLEDDEIKRYGFVSTGNFSESSAKIYTDVTLFTSDSKILKDMSKVFEFFESWTPDALNVKKYDWLN